MEKDVTCQLKIDVVGKAVEVVGVSGVSDTDIKYFPILICLQLSFQSWFFCWQNK